MNNNPQLAKFIGKVKYFVNNLKRKYGLIKKVSIFGESKGQINEILIINLDRQQKRWSNQIDELDRIKTIDEYPLKKLTTRIRAVDGLKINLDSYTSKIVNKLYDLEDHFFVDPDPRLVQLVKTKSVKVGMSSPEVAVAESHVKTWNYIVKNNINLALILEDDVYFDEKFERIANSVWKELTEKKLLESLDLLFFSYRIVDNGLERIQISKNIISPIRGLWWLSGYVLSLSGANKLIANLPVSGPVDMWINLQFSKLNTYASFQPIILQRRDWVSDNNYSIMPILSRVGVHLSSMSNNHSERKKDHHLFAIGLNKTGTTSLHFALSMLGYKCCHWISKHFSEETLKLIDHGKELPFDAYTDVESIVKNYKKLESMYPTALFILNTRNIDNWIASRSRHVFRNQHENNSGANHSWTKLTPSAWRDEFKQHHESVLSFFEDKSEKLLVLDVCGGDNWKKLCDFLDIEIPQVDFPNIDPLIKADSFARNLSNRITLSQRDTVALEHDKHPWIRRPDSLNNYVGVKGKIKGFGIRTGKFNPFIIESKFSDETIALNWNVAEKTFPSNLAYFTRNQVSYKDDTLILTIGKKRFKDRKYSSGSILSKLNFTYGRFEVDIKTTPTSGVITAFFLYRIDPWQEIDIEFLGNDASKMLVNVYYNPGKEGDGQNFGTRGTPVLINLGFDSSSDFHNYAIEWDAEEIRWFVDDDLVHVRKQGRPSPIPNLPLQVHYSIWAIKNKDVAGKLYSKELPKSAQFKNAKIFDWIPKEKIVLK